MLIKTKAIVLSSLKYQEKGLIAKCYTQQDGVKTYFVPNAFSGKKSNQKIAYFQPLTILEIEANHKNKGTLNHFKEIKIAYPVRPEFSGTVKIAGLTSKANVKITDIEGNLVHETTSDGGTIEWDTTAFGKHKVASGVYIILVASQDGLDTTVKKVMIIR